MKARFKVGQIVRFQDGLFSARIWPMFRLDEPVLAVAEVKTYRGSETRYLLANPAGAKGWANEEVIEKA
jgi:hypothetical protein